MTFGLVTLGLLTYTQSAGGVQAATSAEGLGIGKPANHAQISIILV